MVAVVAIDAAMVAADNAEAVKSARSVNYFQKSGRNGDRFFFHHGCARFQRRTT
jgi:hypothetical protein